MCRFAGSILCLGLIASLPAVALAEPIAYEEGAQGDLPSEPQFWVFTLDEGLNTIGGTFGVSAAGPNSTFDHDSFAIVIPDGFEVSSASVAVADVVGNMTAATWMLYAGTTGPSGGTFVENLFMDSPGSDTLENVPLAAGDYHFSQQNILFPFSDPGEHRTSFTFTFTVAAVPEPTGLAFLGLGSVAFLARRRTR